MLDLNELIEQAIELAPLPASTVRLAEMAAHPDCHLEDLAELIAYDQVLTLKLLRAANSAASASATPVGSVSEAVARMGFSQVVTLAVAAGARPILQEGIPGYGLAEGALWRHSVASAVAVETMQASFNLQPSPEAFTAALLHDVGKLVMGRFLSPEIAGYIRRARETDHLDELESESSLLNVNHGELGGLIAQHWNLPARVVLGITYHHNPGLGSDRICDIAYLANLVAKRIEGGLDGGDTGFPVSADVAERLSLTPEMLGELYPIAAKRYAAVSGRYYAV
jgi:HD-like signal output (HDOD) protein